MVAETILPMLCRLLYPRSVPVQLYRPAGGKFSMKQREKDEEGASEIEELKETKIVWVYETGPWPGAGGDERGSLSRSSLCHSWGHLG